MDKHILVTGGAGYIGSHTCVELLEEGYQLVVLDNLSNASLESLKRVQKITGKSLEFVKGDIRNSEDLESVFRRYSISAVIHFAGLKAVGESVEQPTLYYDNNVVGTLRLVEVMVKHKCYTLVFSSSATVYGDPETTPITEDFPLSATNPYGRSKLMIEEMLRDIKVSNEQWSIALLRYFNPVGAHKSGTIGEDPRGVPNNLMPYIAQVAVGQRDKLSVFGDDYPTHDGTGVRDFIHVTDLAKGHVKALQALTGAQMLTVNLGTGIGYSVLDMINAFKQASGRDIPYDMAPRRAGDVAQCFADPNHAKQVIGWQAELGLQEMCADTWRWQKNNPTGYCQ